LVDTITNVELLKLQNWNFNFLYAKKEFCLVCHPDEKLNAMV